MPVQAARGVKMEENIVHSPSNRNTHCWGNGYSYSGYFLSDDNG